MRIAIGADHAGFELKEILRAELADLGDDVVDFGTHSEDSIDYPDIAIPLAHAVARAEHDFGVLICSNGVGPSIAANKVHGIRAALCHDVFSAKRARQHTDANIL
ncbi:MAG: RpiB/LacA/LacB family sugar-phosphate isomerase, partial [Dehalococcoidia bacterium]|nr:RpiB/LacA/LacB family sugar-phosphate isomerase [Dehalococcoidia bacterium]